MTTDRREYFPHEAEMDFDQPLSIIGLMGRPSYIPLRGPNFIEQNSGIPASRSNKVRAS